jgi:hypothetical protein
VIVHPEAESVHEAVAEVVEAEVQAMVLSQLVQVAQAASTIRVLVE